MTPEERERLEDLCRRVAEEKDPLTFEKLVLELNELLEQSTHAFIPIPKPLPTSRLAVDTHRKKR